MDPKTRQRKWTFRMSAPSTEGGVLTTASNVLFAGGRDGQFIAIDARDGKLLWETISGVRFRRPHELHGQWKTVCERPVRDVVVHIRVEIEHFSTETSTARWG